MVFNIYEGISTISSKFKKFKVLVGITGAVNQVMSVDDQ